MNNYEFSKRVSESISAAQRYIGQKEACRGSHKANITVSMNGKDNQCESTVFVYITSKNAAVIIDELHTGNNLQTNKYTADKDIFEIYGNKTLQIRTKRLLCGETVIEISPK